MGFTSDIGTTMQLPIRKIKKRRKADSMLDSLRCRHVEIYQIYIRWLGFHQDSTACNLQL